MSWMIDRLIAIIMVLLNCENHTFIVHFPFVPDAMGYNLLLSFGDQCEYLGL